MIPCDSFTDFMMCWHRRSRDNLCISLIVMYNVCILACLAVALVLRMYVYRDITFLDMPSDQRVVHRSASSMFCTKHMVDAVLEQNASESSNRASFDVYALKDNPEKDKNLTRRLDNITLSSSNRFGINKSKDFTFDLMEGSSVSFRACTKESVNTSTQWFIAKGMANRLNLLRKLADGNPAQGYPYCVNYGRIEALSCPWISRDIKFTSNETDEYALVFFNDQASSQTIISTFTLNRLQYVIPKGYLVGSNTDYQRVDPEDFLVVEFNYFDDKPSLSLSNIILKYKCDPHIMVYLAIFFLIPLVILFIVTCVILYLRSRRGGYNLLASHHDYSDYEPIPES